MKAPPLKNALLEIGTEELPARFISPALEQLSGLVVSGLKEAGIDFSKIETWGTPRRLSVFIYSLAPRAKDRVDVVAGPPPAAAKDDKGHWTPAALGFAKAQGVPVDKLTLEETSKGQRWVARHLIKGQKTEAHLKELYPAVIRKLTFPKTMIWESSRFRFARPIRWIVALYNSHVIPFRLAGVKSDRTTMGLLALGNRKIPIPKPESYKNLLRGRCILIEGKDREKNIQSQMESLAKKIKGTPLVDPAHLNEVVYLTEYPVSILGHFPEAYLKLPSEVLVSVLKKHQKFFPLENAKGQLVNAFIGVRNGPSESQEDVRDGYERVVNARLSDAQFFFSQDSKTCLEKLVPQLAGVGFIQGMGHLLHKTERVRSILSKLGAALKLDASLLETADRAAFLAKADLLTQMVGEFPELQGVAGRFYGLEQEKPEVAHAIEQHYWPLTSDGFLPKSSAAALVAVADKLDTLAAHFYKGLIPTGSADPYGLRRASIGVIRILLDQKWGVSLEDLIGFAFGFDDLYKETEKARQELAKFLFQRCLGWFESQEFRTDEIEAVFSQKQSLVQMAEKLQSLKAVRERPEFGSLAVAIKRARNILQQARQKGVLPGSKEILAETLGHPTEKALYESLKEIHPKFSTALQERRYQDALLNLAALKAPVDDFFNGVMVMVDDEQARSQRLILLGLVKDLFDEIADFSKLQGASLS